MPKSHNTSDNVFWLIKQPLHQEVIILTAQLLFDYVLLIIGLRLDPVDTGHKLNVHKTFRRRPGRLLNVLCTFNLRRVSTGRILRLIFDECINFESSNITAFAIQTSTLLNPFQNNVSFLFPLKMSEKFSDDSKGHRNGKLTWNGLK